MDHLILQLVSLFVFHPIAASIVIPTDVVNTTKGPVQGEILTTIEKKINYSSFNGIPYGKPPVGDRRFKPPVEVDNWTKPFKAIGPTKGCPQFDIHYFGDEDCLYLNVYTPQTKFNSNNKDLRAVMVWIHGGYFLLGDANSSYYGPDFLIEEDVVVVFISYRLGALGFLSLNHPNATGNAALKDQVLALKWVQKNIKNFGGDPSRITILGQSAGAVSVELLTISEMSKGLYNRSIAMSGSPLNYWGFSPQDVAVKQARTLGFLLNLNTANTDEFLKELYTAPARDIVMATQKMIDLTIEIATAEFDLPFKPTIEDRKVSKNVFLDDCAFEKYQKRQFLNLPHLMGFVDAEMAGIFPANLFNLPGKHVNSIDKTFDKLVELARKIVDILHIPLPDFFTRYYEIMRNGTMLNDLNDDISEDILNEGVNVTTDILFILGIDQTQKYRARSTAPVYYYRNSFENERITHVMAGQKLHGVAHGDDLAEIFWMPAKNQIIDPKSSISTKRRRVVRMWTNFAKFANPTPDGAADPLLNITWFPSGKEGNHLEIGANLKMMSRPTDDLVKMAEMNGNPGEELLNGCFDLQN